MYVTHDKQLQDIDYNITFISEKLPVKYAGQEVSDAIIAFDIETTSYFVTPGNKPVAYNYGNSEMLWNRRHMLKQGLMYHWQIAIENNHFTGRTWEELKTFFDDLNAACPAVKFIYVHELSFEFGFLPNIISFSDPDDRILAKEPHRVICAYTKKYNMEFRCSYYLTQLSLNEWGEKYGLPKVDGYNFRELRTPLTQLSPEELAYCIRDVDIVVRGIEDYREHYKHIYNIPFTLTGEVRRELRKVYKNEPGWYLKCKKLQPYSLKSYKWMMSAYFGGCVIAAPAYKDETIKAKFLTKDESSAYPWVMISERYPTTQFRVVTAPKQIHKYMNDPDKTYFVEFSADNVQTRVPLLFLPNTRLLEADGLELVNGRIAAAKHIRLVLCKPDYMTFLKCYFCDVKIHKIKIAELEYLPDCFRKYVIEKYQEKVKFKHADEEIYIKSKKVLSSLYGINVQKLFIDEIVFDIDHCDDDGDPEPWYKKELTKENFNDALRKAFYTDKGRPKQIFIAAQIGIYCTAYARANLWAAILGEAEPGVYSCVDDVIYTDTDAIKMFYTEEAERFFEKYNADIIEKHKIIAEQLGIDPVELSPLDDTGERRPIGVFENDEDMIEFKTLGSKKYVYRSASDKQLHLVVSGVPKNAVVCLHDNINNFRDGFIFSAEEMHDLGADPRLAAFYQCRQKAVTFPDGYYDKYDYSVCLQPIDYTLSKSYDTYSDPDEFIRRLWKLAQETKLLR